MRSTITRLTRAAAGAAIGLALLVGVNVAAAPSASAVGCIGPICGAVDNNTGYIMHYTEALSDSSGPHRCDVWNWDAGNSRNFKHAYCAQRTLDAHAKWGGPRSGHDVDAFTYVGVGYHVRWGPFGTWSWHVQGEWTKISTYETAHCEIGNQREIWCTVVA